MKKCLSIAQSSVVSPLRTLHLLLLGISVTAGTAECEHPGTTSTAATEETGTNTESRNHAQQHPHEHLGGAVVVHAVRHCGQAAHVSANALPTPEGTEDGGGAVDVEGPLRLLSLVN